MAEGEGKRQNSMGGWELKEKLFSVFPSRKERTHLSIQQVGIRGKKKFKLIKKLNIHRTLFIKIHLAKWVK